MESAPTPCPPAHLPNNPVSRGPSHPASGFSSCRLRTAGRPNLAALPASLACAGGLHRHIPSAACCRLQLLPPAHRDLAALPASLLGLRRWITSTSPNAACCRCPATTSRWSLECSPLLRTRWRTAAVSSACGQRSPACRACSAGLLTCWPVLCRRLTCTQLPKPVPSWTRCGHADHAPAERHAPC